MAFFARFLGGWQIYALIAAISFGAGGWTVYKFVRAGEIGGLTAELERRDQLDAERAAIAQELERRARVLEAQLTQVRNEVRTYVPTDPNCVLPVDGVRLLNSNRPTDKPAR